MPKAYKDVIRISPDTHKRLKDYVKKTGLKVQFVADLAIVSYLETMTKGMRESVSSNSQ